MLKVTKELASGSVSTTEAFPITVTLNGVPVEAGTQYIVNDNTSDNGSGVVSAGQSEMMKVMSSKPGNSGIHHVNFAPGNRSIINNTKGFFGNYTPLR
ncbi:MAG: hypothetical protein IKJ46_03510 [Tidjanibacter sp.]|nr:hypothetical protein [Tidjanibacter sp.]